MTGTITYKGQPVNGALLRFYPQAKEAQEFSVPVGQDGTFSSFDTPPGEYKIVVEAPNIPKITPPQDATEEAKQKYQQAYGQDTPTIPFPNKYKNISSTDLKITITQGEKQNLPLELKD